MEWSDRIDAAACDLAVGVFGLRLRGLLKALFLSAYCCCCCGLSIIYPCIT